MIPLGPVVLVEGKYDQNKILQIFDATVLTTGGFQIFKNEEQVRLLRRLAETRGLLILTDSDGAGFVIRNKLRGALTGGRVYQAYIPDLPGKEKRKRAPSKEGKLGVEGVPDESSSRPCAAAARSTRPPRRARQSPRPTSMPSAFPAGRRAPRSAGGCAAFTGCRSI